MSTTRELITQAEAAAARHSTPSHIAEALLAAIALTRRDEREGSAALEAALADLATFRHITTERGEVVALSMYVRGLLDSASWAESDRTQSPADLARIATAIAMIDAGDEAGVVALEVALGRETR